MQISKREATPKPQELVLQGLKIRQVPTSLNRLGLNARNIDIRQVSDNSVILMFDSGQMHSAGFKAWLGATVRTQPNKNPTSSSQLPLTPKCK